MFFDTICVQKRLFNGIRLSVNLFIQIELIKNISDLQLHHFSFTCLQIPLKIVQLTNYDN